MFNCLEHGMDNRRAKRMDIWASRIQSVTAIQIH